MANKRFSGLSECGALELMEKADDDVVVEKGIDTTIEGKLLAMTKGEILTSNTKPVFDLTPESTQEEIESVIEGTLELLPADRVEAAAMLSLHKQAIDASKPEIEKLQKQKEIILDKIKSKKDEPKSESVQTKTDNNVTESNKTPE